MSSQSASFRGLPNTLARCFERRATPRNPYLDTHGTACMRSLQYNAAAKFAIYLLILLSLMVPLLGMPSTLHAQSSGRGTITGYNEATQSAILDVSNSDLRFNQISAEMGIMAVTINDITLQTYFFPQEMADANADTVNLLNLRGFDPIADEIELVMLISRSGSFLQHVDGVTNPLTLFDDPAVGDTFRFDFIDTPPLARQQSLSTRVLSINTLGDVILDITREDATAQGLINNLRGEIAIGDRIFSFSILNDQDYFLASGDVDLYLQYQVLPVFDPTAEADPEPDALPPQQYLEIVPPPSLRNTMNLATLYNITPQTPITLSYPFYSFGVLGAGVITDIQDNGRQLITDIPDAYLDDLGIPLGGYVVVVINGQLRAALVMDETMFAASFEFGGLSSNYVVLRQTGILKIIYMPNDTRDAVGVFEAQVSDIVRLRAARATETIIREEAIVKVVAEVDSDGFFYTDITPFELSFMAVLLGQYVDVTVNGINYRAQVVDADLLQTTEDDVLVFPLGDYVVITHPESNSLTVETRFQVSVGDAIIIQPAPN